MLLVIAFWGSDLQYHPSREIVCKLSHELEGHTVILGVSYSAAIYRAIDVARHLLRYCANVKVLLTPKAAHIIAPDLFHWATGERPLVELSGDTEHIALSKIATSMVIAPATLNTLAKIAHGIADNVVIATAIVMNSFGKPVIVVPTMHREMLLSKQAREIISKLYEQGYQILPPIEENHRIVFPSAYYIARKVVASTLRGEDLRDMRITVTAGATREYIDDIRFISNPSTGRMGIAIALEAFFRGASVNLITGHIEVPLPPWIHIDSAVNTEEMAKVIIRTIERRRPHAVIMAAAPADFKPRERAKGKISSRIEKINLELIPTTKILKELRKVYDGVLVGFAAESVTDLDELAELAKRKLEEYELDAIVANPIGKKGIGFASPINEVIILLPNGTKIHRGPTIKEEIARDILDIVKDLIKKKLGAIE